MRTPPLTLVWDHCTDPMLWLGPQGELKGQNKAALEALGADPVGALGGDLEALWAGLAEDGPNSGVLSLEGQHYLATLSASSEGAVLTLVRRAPVTWTGEWEAQARRLAELQVSAELAKLGAWEMDVPSMALRWSTETFRIHELEPGPQPDLAQAVAFYAPEAQGTIAAGVERAMATGEPWDLELPLITAKGNRIWVRAYGRPEYQGGRVVRLFGIIQDLSRLRLQRREMEEALEVAREFERLFHAAGAMICSGGEDRRFQRLNSVWTRTLGWSLEELRSRSFLSFVHPEDREATMQAIQRILPDGAGPTFFENRYQHKDGSYRWLHWHSFARGSDGRFYAVASDVTEARLLREEYSRMALAVSRTDNAVVVTDCAGVIEWFNDGFLRQTGFAPDEVLGAIPFSLLQGPETDRAVSARIHQAILAGRAFQEVLINYRKDGSSYWSEVDAQPLFDQDGVLEGFMAIGRDVTERYEQNAALRAAKERADQEAQASARASSAKSNFLAAMSHEIRTPLNGVLGLAQLLASGPLGEEEALYADRILSSGRALLSLLDDILDFSKVEAGRMELHRRPFRLEVLLGEVIGLFQASAVSKGLDLTLELDPNLPEWLLGDAFKLRQVLTNLIGNALKFTFEGRVHLEISGDGQGSGLRIQVRDTGVGVAPDKLESIFESFAQEDSGTTRRFGGTGLGLAISQQLVELMGGRIWAQGNTGGGTCFTIELPMETVDPPTVAPLALAKRPQERISAHVLVVEDNPVNQLVTVAMIHRLGGTTQVAGDGRAALKRLSEERFDLILMDWHMPVMDGLDATQAIRAGEPPGERVPILGLTANAYDVQVQRCLEAGMDAVLTKPIEWSLLAEAVARWTQAPVELGP